MRVGNKIVRNKSFTCGPAKNAHVPIDGGLMFPVGIKQADHCDQVVAITLGKGDDIVAVGVMKVQGSQILESRVISSGFVEKGEIGGWR